MPELQRTLPIHDGSLEAVVHARPDMVLVGQYNALMLRERLKQLGVTVKVLPLPKNLAELMNYEQSFLRLMNLPLSLARQAPPPRGKTGKRLLLLEPNGIGTGRDTFENDLIEYAGWTNYLEEPGIVRLDLERIIQDPPDAIHWTGSPHPALANRFAEHPVLAKLFKPEQRLQTEAWRWTCPGPWTWELIEQIAE